MFTSVIQVWSLCRVMTQNSCFITHRFSDTEDELITREAHVKRQPVGKRLIPATFQSATLTNHRHEYWIQDAARNQHRSWWCRHFILKYQLRITSQLKVTVGRSSFVWAVCFIPSGNLRPQHLSGHRLSKMVLNGVSLAAQMNQWFKEFMYAIIHSWISWFLPHVYIQRLKALIRYQI